MAEILIGNIKGPQGAKGDKGDKGDTGPQGPAGPQGATGPMPALVNGFTTTEAGIAALDAAAGKTLKDEVTQLNSDMLIDRGAVTGDFNNYLSPGIYRYTGSSSVGNNPGDVAGNLEVIVTSSYVIHRFTAYNRMYTRIYDGSSWTDWTSCVTNADLDGHIALLSAGATALEAFSGNTRFRLQLNNNGNVTLYRSTDGGSTWPESKTVATWS